MLQTPKQYQGVGQYGSRLEGFDSGKLNSDYNSPKYQIGRVLSNFDPRKGITPEVLQALNALGIGTFSGSGDRLNIANGTAAFDGVNSLDVVRGFNDPNGTGGWQYGVDGPAPAGAPSLPQRAVQMALSTPSAPAAPVSTPVGRSSQISSSAAASNVDSSNFTPAEAAAAGLGWVPKDHPLYGTPGYVGYKAPVATPPATNGGASGPQPNPADYSPYGRYPARQSDTVNPELEKLSQDLLGNILRNPRTLNDQAVNQMKETGKETAVGLQQQLQDKIQSDALARGVVGGGYTEGLKQRSNDAMLSDIIRGNRDVDLKKVETDRADEINALGAGTGYLNGANARALGNYNADLNGFFSNLAAQDRSRGLDIQQDLGNKGIAVDNSRIGEDARQFNASNTLANLIRQDNNERFADTMGFNYTQLDSNAQQAAWDAFLQSLRPRG